MSNWAWAGISLSGYLLLTWFTGVILVLIDHPEDANTARQMGGWSLLWPLIWVVGIIFGLIYVPVESLAKLGKKQALKHGRTWKDDDKSEPESPLIQGSTYQGPRKFPIT